MQTRSLILLYDGEGLTKSYATSNTHKFRNRASVHGTFLGSSGRQGPTACLSGGSSGLGVEIAFLPRVRSLMPKGQKSDVPSAWWH